MVTKAGAGRALGQRIGNLIEDKTHEILEPVCEALGYKLVRTGRISNIYGKSVKHDGLVIDEAEKPHIILECKYVQKAKHATEKATKAANEHPLIKRKHQTLKGSFAILAGDFTPATRKLIIDSGGRLFFIDKSYVDKVFRKYGITVQWKDKEAESIAPLMLKKFMALSDQNKDELGNKLIARIKKQIVNNTQDVLTNTQNALSSIGIEIFYTAGNVSYATFKSIKDAKDYFNQLKGNPT